MHDLAEGTRLRGNRVDKSVLKYLRTMVTYCRLSNDREMRWYYEAAWDFAAGKVYGPLPPRHGYSKIAGESPETIVTPWLPGSVRPAAREMPLRKIVKRFTRPYNNSNYSYETLECYHILMAPVGYSVPARSRRCPHCAIARLSTQKKSVTTAATAPLKKAATA